MEKDLFSDIEEEQDELDLTLQDLLNINDYFDSEEFELDITPAIPKREQK